MSVVEVGAALDDQVDADWNCLGHISGAGQVDGEGLEGNGDVALDWDAEVGRKQTSQFALVFDGDTVTELDS